ncbi:hypothetical protein HDE71_005332 [Janthinobacterium sp. S3M3]|nr:hypothetical protein [Janthinobacterium sp. S3T4]MBB5616248.1 hypothetical protein [Janthinobacterium sp. S3M3]
MQKLNVTVLMLACVAALCSCQSPLPVVAVQPQIPQLPMEIATKREPNLTQRLRQLLAPLPATATTPPAS